jgi:UDP-glucose 4-epimerase
MLGVKERLRIYGTDYDTSDGTALRDYVHVTDLAEAHSQALTYLCQGGRSRAFNLGTGHGHTVLQVANKVQEIGKRKFAVEFCARRPGDPAVLVASASEAMRELRWRPRHSDLDTIISSALQWRTRAAASLRVASARCAAAG